MDDHLRGCSACKGFKGKLPAYLLGIDPLPVVVCKECAPGPTKIPARPSREVSPARVHSAQEHETLYGATSAAVEGFSSEDVSSFLRDHELAIHTPMPRASNVLPTHVPSLFVEDLATFQSSTVAESSLFAEEIATLLQAITTVVAPIDRTTRAAPCTPAGTTNATAPRSSRFSKESWDASPS